MTGRSGGSLTARDVLRRYQDELLLEFAELNLVDVNQRGHFGDYPIHVAATRGSVEELGALIEGGADANAVGEREYTPLHAAVSQEHIDAVNLLLRNGAQLDLKTEDGETPLDIALRKQRSDIAAILKWR